METALTRLLNEKLQEKFDGNASELARVVGTSQQNISNWLIGDVIKPAYWKKAARALGILEAELYPLMQKVRLDAGGNVSDDVWHAEAPAKLRAMQLDDEDRSFYAPKQLTPPPITPGAIVPPNATIGPKTAVITTNKMLPVLGMAVGGEDGRYIFNGSVIDYVVCPPSLENVAGAYAVYIDGESMYPRFKAGETVWVHPGKPARRGDDVIVQLKPIEDDGSPPWGYVKEFVGRQGNNLVLRQYNPPIEIQFDVNEVLTTHPIVLAGKY
ncbi:MULTISPECIES: LexA family transcriptional regulator [Agrobacterium]|uniref:LexA family transcriptional regulator n=1 Tax=Agrobacterium tumefaciens TaxID=358 RepID=UPI001573F94D|nr:Repressor protein C [Agrobacterium tumefaciens]NSZ06480.1 Repressor protein C [Agrobacterium tumefaciens]